MNLILFFILSHIKKLQTVQWTISVCTETRQQRTGEEEEFKNVAKHVMLCYVSDMANFMIK